MCVFCLLVMSNWWVVVTTNWEIPNYGLGQVIRCRVVEGHVRKKGAHQRGGDAVWNGQWCIHFLWRGGDICGDVSWVATCLLGQIWPCASCFISGERPYVPSVLSSLKPCEKEMHSQQRMKWKWHVWVSLSEAVALQFGHYLSKLFCRDLNNLGLVLHDANCLQMNNKIICLVPWDVK